MKVVITDAEYGDSAIERQVMDEAGIELVEAGNVISQEDVVRACADADGLITQYADIGAYAISQLPGLKVISRYGTGYDNVDVTTATAHGIVVCNVPSYGADEVAFHTVTLALAAVRELEISSWGRWTGQGPPAYPALPSNPADLVIGIAGMGRIGRRVAELSLPLFRDVVWYDPFVGEDVAATGTRCITLGELAERANILTLHMPLNAKTRGIVDAAILTTLREPRYLVNASRAEVVRQPDLLAAIENSVLRAAALDVIEPGETAQRLVSSPRVLVTPHMAWASPGAQIDCRRKAAENVVSVLLNRGTETVVPEQRAGISRKDR